MVFMLSMEMRCRPQLKLVNATFEFSQDPPQRKQANIWRWGFSCQPTAIIFHQMLLEEFNDSPLRNVKMPVPGHFAVKVFWDSPNQSSGKAFFQGLRSMASDWEGSATQTPHQLPEVPPQAQEMRHSKGRSGDRAAAAGDGQQQAARQTAGFLLAASGRHRCRCHR